MSLTEQNDIPQENQTPVQSEPSAGIHVNGESQQESSTLTEEPKRGILLKRSLTRIQAQSQTQSQTLILILRGSLILSQKFIRIDPLSYLRRKIYLTVERIRLLRRRP